jgi:hypothetical protein
MDDAAHNALEASRARERKLEARVHELEARLASIEGRGDQGPAGEPGASAGAGDAAADRRAKALFAQLRSDHEAEGKPVPSPRPKAKAKGKGNAKGTATIGLVPDPSVADSVPTDTPDATLAAAPDGEPELTGDDLLRATRDAVLEPLVAELARVSKRQLQDEQNVLLDAARRANARVDPAKVLPEPAQQRNAWGDLLAPSFDTAYGAGRAAAGTSRRSGAAPERLVNELALGLVLPLRERLQGTVRAVLARGPYESPAELHREMAAAIGARYREWKGEDLHTRLGDALAVAYARGTYDGAPSGAHLRWVPDAGDRCPDCDDNALEVTVKGQPFPTGQAHPPAHPGCRCLVVTVVRDGSEPPVPI